MGYNTDFSGSLQFLYPLKTKERKDLEAFFGEDCRDHKDEWDAGDLTWIDLELTEDESGIQWNGSEKSYDMCKKINMIIRNMRKKYPNFGFSGKMIAQDEDLNDRYEIFAKPDGTVEEGSISITAICPKCGHSFLAE